MGINCKIELGANAQSRRVLNVILRSLGHEYSIKNYSNKQFNQNFPSSKENSWSINFESKLGKTVAESIAGCLSFKFKTLSLMEHSWFCSTEGEREGFYSIMPGSYAMSMLVGKKLVDFFGGFVLFNDSYDWDNEKYVYVNEKPLFGMQQKASYKEDLIAISNERYYEMNNKLLAFEPLNNNDLLWFQKRGIDLGEEGAELIHQISVISLHNKLDKSLDNKTVVKKKKL